MNQYNQYIGENQICQVMSTEKRMSWNDINTYSVGVTVYIGDVNGGAAFFLRDHGEIISDLADGIIGYIKSDSATSQGIISQLI